MIVDYSTFDVMWKDECIGTIVYSDKEFKVDMKDHFRNPFKFIQEPITRKHVSEFIRDQCFDEHNACAKDILKSLGLEYYSPWEIVEITNAICTRNKHWIKFKGEELDYERDIATRRVLGERLREIRERSNDEQGCTT